MSLVLALWVVGWVVGVALALVVILGGLRGSRPTVPDQSPGPRLRVVTDDDER